MARMGWYFGCVRWNWGRVAFGDGVWVGGVSPGLGRASLGSDCVAPRWRVVTLGWGGAKIGSGEVR